MKTRQNGPDLFAPSKLKWLDEARTVARRLLEHREFVTIEDVTAECPLPRYLNRNTIGGVFRTADFQMVGMTNARRPSSNGRWIFKWVLKNPAPPKRVHMRGEADSGD